MNLTIILLYLTAAVFGGYILVYKIRRRKFEVLGEMIPGHPAYPLVGNSLLFAGVRSSVDLWYVGMKTLKQLCDTYGTLFRVWLGPMLVVCITDLDDMNTLLSSPHASTKHWWYVRLLNVMSHGIFGMNGKDWQELKKPFLRYFPIKEIESYSGIFESKAVQLASKFDKKVGAGVFNVHHVVKFFPLDVVCATHLGVHTDEMEENKHDFHHHLERSLEIAFTRALRPEYLLDGIYKLTNMGRENVKADHQVTGISRWIIQERMKILESRGIDLKSDFEEEFYTDSIIKKGMRENWTLHHMALGITDVIVGGSDTTAIVLAYTLLCLAMHPEYQERAYQEQMEMFGESDRLPTFHEAQAMPYLGMCLKEALRLFGPVGIARELTADFQLGDYLLPEGSALFFIFYQVHRNPAYYCRPHEFYPDHFSAEQCSRRPKLSFFGFSQGTRGCPGSLYSNISGKIALSLLIRKFRFSSPIKFSDMKFKYSLMVENVDGYPLEIHRRNYREAA
ncbi:hypothetical protein GE061_018038 [Apolygus lucorum]|uniref:Uncharacterized protein n=1 Tax=Apolygus lucorum TaxID=248454 RepID=A0A6A4J465_APOLU|nr:hypothetical protein GE061_018038 [Apolygus lucorum]